MGYNCYRPHGRMHYPYNNEFQLDYQDDWNTLSIYEKMCYIKYVLDTQSNQIDSLEERVKALEEEIKNINTESLLDIVVLSANDGVIRTSDIADAVAGGNKVVVFNKGEYLVDAPIFLESNTALLGLNATIKLVDNVSTIPFSLFVAEGGIKNDISFKSLKIDGNRDNNIDHGQPNAQGNQDQFFVGTLLALINLTQVNNSVVEDCELINSWGSGLWVSDCVNFKVENNLVHSYRITGIAIRNNTSLTTTPKNVIVNNNECYGGVVGIHHIFGVIESSISSNYCHNNRDENRFPNNAYLGSYPNVYPNDPLFNTSTNPNYVSPALEGDGSGIELTGKYTDPASITNGYTSIGDNVCSNNAVGIRLEESTNNVAVSNNTCNLNTVGILLFSAFFNNIANNKLSENFTGMTIQQLSPSLVPSAVIPTLNNVVGNSMTDNKEYGLRLGNAQRNMIVNNIISSNNVDVAQDGGSIFIEGYDGNLSIKNQICGNQFINYNGNDKNGINDDGAGHFENIIKDNFFENFLNITCSLGVNNNVIEDNVGFKTQAHGSATVLNGNGFVTVTHGLVYTPFNGEIQVTAVTDIPNNEMFYVGNITATTFDIIVNIVGGVTKDTFFNWSISNK